MVVSSSLLAVQCKAVLPSTSVNTISAPCEEEKEEMIDICDKLTDWSSFLTPSELLL